MATNGGTAQGWSPVLGFKTVTGKYEIGSLNDTGYINYYHDTRTSNGIDFQLIIPKATGTLATQEWVTGAYVKKAGDTMSGILKIQCSSRESLVINGSDNGNYIGFNTDGKKGWVGRTSGGIFLQNGVASGIPYIYLKDDGGFKFVSNGEQTIWHSGNDGSGSGLDADLLDGVHNGDLTARTFKLLRHTSSTSDTSNLAIIKQHYTEIPVEAPCTLGLSHGSLSMAFGWRLGGSYNSVSSAYCGWFISDYGTPRWIGADAGAWKSETFAFLSSTVANANSLGGVAASQYARIQQANNFVHAENEITLIPAGFTYSNKQLWINYRCGADGSNANFNEYVMGNGTKGGTASVRAASFIKSGGTSSQFLKADGSVDSNSYLTTGSAASTYVKKAGDTMTGLLTISHASTQVAVINSTAGNETFLRVQNAGSSKSCFGWHPTYGTYLYHSVGAHYIGIRDNGSPYFDSSKIWHAGNDGSGSGLDADLLDGLHNGEVTAKKLTAVTPTTTGVTVATAKTNFLNAIKGAAFGNVTVIEASLINNWGSDSTTLTGSSGYSAINVTPRYDGDTYGQFLLFHYGSYSPKIVGRNSGAWTTLRTFAFLDDNVASATKLATARTIWGQSFNGTGNVSGSLSSVGNITGSGAIVMTANGRFTLNAAATALDLKFANDDTKSVILNGSAFKPFDVATHKLTLGSSTAVWERIYGRYIDTDSGYDLRFCAAGTERMHIVAASGNVGIGTESPSRKLHVNGDIQTSSIYASNWLRTTGNTGWYNESYGGGWYMTDTTWIKNYNSKKLQILGSTDYNAILVASGGCIAVTDYAGDSWNKGKGAFNVGITDNSAQTPLLLAYRKGKDYPVSGGAYRLFVLELLNSGTMLRFAFGGAYKFEMNSAGAFHAVGGIYSDGYVSARGQNTSSDERLKNILRPLSLNVHDIANAPSVEFVWKKDGIKDVGSIAQYWRKLIPQLAPDMPDGSMGLQYGKTALMSVIAVARKTVSLEERITQLEAENRELKAQISQLKTQLT